MRTKVLLLLLVVACCLWMIRSLLESEELYICDLQGVDLYTTYGEMRRSSALIFGYLADGREVAVGRYGLERCRKWETDH